MEPPEQRAPPAATREPVLDDLQARLGLPLACPEIALAALTHKSFVNEHRGEGLRDNERLEFLGDAVIDLAVSHRLMEQFPDAREGELSKIRAAVVDEAGLARIARELDLGPLLRLGRGEELTGGRQKNSLLADALEAVVAAVYLGGGLVPVLELIDRFLGDAFARAAAGTLDRDYKTQLQELAQSRLRASPRYRVFAEHGPDHSKVFEVELELKGEVVGRGAGRSKKDAEQAAAKLALGKMNERAAGVTDAPPVPSGARAAACLEPLPDEQAAPPLPDGPYEPERAAAPEPAAPVEPPPEPTWVPAPEAKTDAEPEAAPSSQGTPAPTDDEIPARRPARRAPRVKAAPKPKPKPKPKADAARPSRKRAGRGADARPAPARKRARQSVRR